MMLISMLISPMIHATESIEPPHPETSFGIAAKVLSKLFINTHYKVIGSCTWAVGKFPPKMEVVPAIEQFLPDLIITVSNRPETNPWIEAHALYENPASQALYQKAYQLATGSALGFGDDAGQTSDMHINEERTRVVDVIGSPAGVYRFPYLSHKPETRFGYPYYISEADAVSDRTELAEIAYMATHPDLLFNHDIGSSTQSWGHEIPRLMRVTQPSRFRASVVAALHAADIVTNKNSLHVTQSTSNSCGPNCVVANVVFDAHHKNVIWQEVYPNNRNINFSNSDMGIKDEKSGNGNYIFVVWRKYRGCIQHKGKLVHALSYPKVGQPQKR
ncbi:TraU protein [Legionella birminghamensis]|uniref:Integrating conjugative element protein, PFL_4710 family n=1 Tax=Legionella birminghamensis TaxID=28083 RepID=A0A378IAE4_9GAMM|nr:TIGR03756 family integrating conjugative element protein [Legionella birminghamensis]KTC76169.1 TraU protein [Legionella birminghamensis]STX32207.1 integrating conjugative element protein, PFL_4710 family [Legionella birminghamensis]